jgi:mRNA interferase MazF
MFEVFVLAILVAIAVLAIVLIKRHATVHVVLMTGDTEEEADWQRLAAEQFFQGYAPGDDIYDQLPAEWSALVIFPFAHGGQGKQRPALVIADTCDNDVVLARVTTQNWNTSFDVQLADWHAAGLMAPSVAWLHKLATINKSLVQRQLGKLTSKDSGRVGTALALLCGGW